MSETKNEKFVRLMSSRLDMFVEVMRKIRNLSRPAYEYTIEDVDWIRNKINTVVDDMLADFDKPKR
jgi:phosphoribosylpyrophosphate synthetase